MRRICVFCGSSPGARPEYVGAARQLGRELANRGIELVFGGASVGAMGGIAQTVLEEGGRVIGVIPRDLVEREVAFAGLPDLRVVDSMHERKALMAELSDGFIALPGGLGTTEEFLEVFTWAQLGIHRKPCGLLNVARFYDRLVNFLDYAVAEQFVQPEMRAILLIDEEPQRLLDKLQAYRPPDLDKARWILRMNKGN